MSNVGFFGLLAFVFIFGAVWAHFWRSWQDVRMMKAGLRQRRRLAMKATFRFLAMGLAGLIVWWLHHKTG